MTSVEAWSNSNFARTGKRKIKEMNASQNEIKKNLCYNLFYSIGCLAFLSGCLYQSWSFLDIYFKYPTTMEVNVVQEPVVMFPAVTVCNGNRVRQNVWCKYDAKACEPKPTDIVEAQDYITGLQDRYKYVGRSTRIKMGHQKQDFIKSCQFEERNCMDLIGQYFNYEYTNCFTVNGRWANQSLEPLSSSMFRPRSGRSSELSIMLNVERQEYSPMNPVVRARMTIHSPETVPNPQYDGVSIQPGRTYNYGVRKNIVHVLPSPYQTHCKNYTGLKERRTNATFTQEDCMSECCAYSHIQFCDCTVHRLSLIYDLRTCWDPKEIQCLKEKDELVKKLCYPQCGMPCSKTTYSYISVDSYALQQGSCVAEDLYNRTLSGKDRENLICLRVYYSATESDIYSHRPKYNGIQVFSVIGGYIGLWLGVSFLDVHSYAINILLICFGKKRANVKTNGVKPKMLRYDN